MAPASSRPRPATPTDVSEAIARRRRAEQRRNTLLLSGVAALVLLALAMVWLVRFSPVLSARQVEVTGTRLVSQDRVVQAAQVPLGTPLARLETDPIAQRVASQLTEVGQVRVSTSLPGTVRIEVTERTAVYLRHSGSVYQSVDASGVIFATAAKPAKGAIVASTATVDNRLLADVATVVQALPTEVRGQVTAVDATSPDRIVLSLTKGRSVVWGSAVASDQKAPVLVALLGQKATVFDVSSPGSPTTR
ncbi:MULTISPECIES: cell division protein FtsQ/DivIB [unclassified Luteococcus]|uniref:cell division protein FtsQ/DivIB n=1 Tax=unclassified Luteococcus TaxID=2639923 RepID=UPI00313B8238